MVICPAICLLKTGEVDLHELAGEVSLMMTQTGAPPVPSSSDEGGGGRGGGGDEYDRFDLSHPRRARKHKSKHKAEASEIKLDSLVPISKYT